MKGINGIGGTPHDTGRSGWWYLFGIPFLVVANIIDRILGAGNNTLLSALFPVSFVGYIVLLVFKVQGSEPGENRYGPNPNPSTANGRGLGEEMRLRPNIGRLSPSAAADAGASSVPASMVKRSTPGIGIAGFVLSLLGFPLLFLLFPGVLGLVFSVFGYTRAKRDDGPKGLCIAGMAIGALCTLLVVLVLLVASLRSTTPCLRRGKTHGLSRVEQSLQLVT